MKQITLCCMGVLFLSPAYAGQSALNYGFYYGSDYFNNTDDSRLTSYFMSWAYDPDKHNRLKLALSYNKLRYMDNGSLLNAQGVGDAMLSYRHSYNFSSSTLDVEGKVKLPLADEKKGLGTGKKDYAVALGFYQLIQQQWIYAKAGYKWRGDSSSRPMLNGYDASVGVMLQFVPSWSAGTSLSYTEASSVRSEAYKDWMLHLNFNLSPTFKTMTYAQRSLSGGMVSWSGGMQFTHVFK